MHTRARRLRFCDNGLGGKVKGNAENVGVLDIEFSILVQIIRLPPQRAPDDLLAQQLCAKRANAQNVRDGVGVPALGQHRNRNDTANRFAQASGLADRIHHFAQQILVGEIVRLSLVAGALQNFAAKAFNLIRRHTAKIRVQRFARLELLAVNQQRVGTRERIAIFVIVAKQFQPPRYQRCRAIFICFLKPRDKVIHQFRDGGILTDDNETGRRLNVRGLPPLKRFLVMPVQRFKGGLQFDGQAERVEVFVFAATFFRHLAADVFPNVAKLGHLTAGDIVGDRHARQFHDATFNRVHQRKIAHRPGKNCPFGIARALEKKRRRGKVNDLLQTNLVIHHFQTANPQARGFIIGFRFGAVIARQILFFWFRSFTIAVMPFVVDSHDIFHAHQFRHDALQHLPFRFQRV